MRLPPFAYRLLQRIVHKDYSGERRTIGQWYARQAGEPVLELGCGTGTFYDFFPAGTYTGVDFDAARIKEASRLHPQGDFQAADATTLPARFLRRYPMIVCWNFFHHLSDEQSERVLRTIRDAVLDRPIRLIAGEPTLPRFRDNPVGFLLAKADDGKHVRSLEGMKRLFGEALRSTTVGQPNPIWPVPGACFELEFVNGRPAKAGPGEPQG